MVNGIGLNHNIVLEVFDIAKDAVAKKTGFKLTTK